MTDRPQPDEPVDETAIVPATPADGSSGPQNGARRPEQASSRIGPYTLVRLIGEGGFGSVFLAEQATPVKRQVALKIVKLGMDTQQVVARFEQERQALALMDHPGIAKVFDAGATDAGRPYFVMEMVDGCPIAAFCDEHELTIDDRLRLFAEVCAAVQHAHSKGIIHRDLKPSNILVGLEDGRPRARVIDFGIAKATGPQLTDLTLFTVQGQFIGTPEYMSPEQAEGSLDIDTRTDVYALGVVLYELLTGTVPFAAQSLRSQTYAEIQRILREVDPPRPSTRVSQQRETLAVTAARRRTEPRRLPARLRGDLDWIVMRALEKDPDRRYETANGLAMDIRRYLDGEAVVAAPPGAGYRLRKFVRRNRGLVTAAGAVAAALLAGVIAFAWQASEARDQRDRAVQAEALTQARADELQQVAGFQAQMLSRIDPARAGQDLMRDLGEKLDTALAAASPAVPAAERASRVAALTAQLNDVNATDAAADVIDRTILRPSIVAVDEEFADQPLVAASLRQTLADVYRSLGRYDAALTLQEQALASRRQRLGDRAPATLVSASHLGLLLMARGELPAAEALFREVEQAAPGVLGEEHPETLDAISNLGTVLVEQGKLSEAEPYYHRSLDLQRRLHGDDDRGTLVAINNMGYLFDMQGKLDEAEPYYREAVARCRRLLGDEHDWTLSAINNLAVLMQTAGKLDEAEPLYREALATSRRVLGDEHPNTLNAIANLGALLKYQGKLDAAEPLYREALEKRRRVLGADHPATLVSTHNLASLLRDEGKLDEADAVYREALAGRRRVLGDQHPSTLSTISSLGSLLVSRGRDAEAAKLLAAAEPDARAALTGARAPRLAFFLMTLGRARGELKEFTAAEGNLIEAHGILSDSPEPSADDLRTCTEALVALYAAWDSAEPGGDHAASRKRWAAALADLD
ncbi:MAG: serine/threonine-protein kinase [Candidatus Krumholzibacteriia bacterium]